MNDFVTEVGGAKVKIDYGGNSTITGPSQDNDSVEYTPVLSTQERVTLLGFLLFAIITTFNLIWYVFTTFAIGTFSLVILTALGAILALELIRFVLNSALVIYAFLAKDPVPMKAQSGLKIAMLTTIVPSKEPFTLVSDTLRNMKWVNPGHGNTLDVWLLDEGDDPQIKAQCLALGINHFSRKDVEVWNTTTGTYKARTKHGNHNAWRSAHADKYDLVAVLDPDHIPRFDFLDRTLGYFRDPEVGFVVAPQKYGNVRESWVARAAAFQSYVFHGVIQRGGNGLKTPLLEGTNHVYRVAAFKTIDGYQDSIIEDHLTALKLYGAQNKDGERWKGVYTPDVIAVGEGPTTLTDYFNQQKRWAYGIWDIVRNHSREAFTHLGNRQKLAFGLLQFYYPAVAAMWVLGAVIAVMLEATPVQSTGSGRVLSVLWICSTLTNLGLFYWLRRFNTTEHERKDFGLLGIGLALMTLPVYVSAGFQALTKRPLRFTVTAKGNLASRDTLATFLPHLHWLGINLAALGVAIVASGQLLIDSNVSWTLERAFICIAPLVIYLVACLKSLHPIARTQLTWATAAKRARRLALAPTAATVRYGKA